MPQEQDSNKQGVWWGWWVLFGVVIVCAVCVIAAPSSQVNVTDSVPIHTTEATANPETYAWPPPPDATQEGYENDQGDCWETPENPWAYRCNLPVVQPYPKEGYENDCPPSWYSAGEDCCFNLEGGRCCYNPKTESPTRTDVRCSLQPKEGYEEVFTSPPPIWTSPAPVITSPPPIWTSPAPVITSPPPDTEEPECPSEIPGVYPDALDPVFRNCQAKKLAACYAKCHSIDPLYFFYNP